MEYQEEYLEQQVSIQEYLNIIYRGKWIIIASTVIIFIIALIVTYTTDPVFEAKTTIILQQKQTQGGLFDFGGMQNESLFMRNQVEIIKSRTLARQVLHALESSENRDQYTIFKPDEEGMIMPEKYQVGWLSFHLSVNPLKDTDIIELSYSAPSAWEAANIANIYAEEYRLYTLEYNREEKKLLRKFLVQQIRLLNEDLHRSEEALLMFQQENNIISLDQQVQSQVEKLAEIESQLEAAKVEQSGLLQREKSLKQQISERRKALSGDLINLTSEYFNTLQKELARKKAEKTKYEVQVASAIDVDKKLISGELTKLDRQIKALEDKLREEGKKVVESNMVQDPFGLTQTMIKDYLQVQTEIAAVNAKIQILQNLMREKDLDYHSLPKKEMELARLERAKLVDEQTYLLLNQKLEETRISEAGERENARVLDQALLPEIPIKPKKKLNMIIGVLLGLGLGVGIVFLIEYLDNSIKSIEELERSNYKVLGAIPAISTNTLEKQLIMRPDETVESFEGRRIESRLVTHLDPKSPVSEAYRTIRTNIQFALLNQEISTIIITSSGPKEGKSTTISNLAITLSQLGQKTILIDADLRRPVIHSIFGLNKEEGLSQYLMGKIEIKDIIKETMIENLSVISCGLLPPNPSELLSSERMTILLEKLKNEYSTVLIDTPPVIAVTDAAVLATRVDGVIVVLKANATEKEVFERAESLLKSVNANILGVVLNALKAERGFSSSPYYHAYYAYYGGKERKRKKRMLGY